MKALGPGDLAITSATLGNPPFAELVAAASAAGLSGLSLWAEHDYARARRAGYSDADVRSMAADNGLQIVDIDGVIVWAGPDDPGPPYFEEAPPELAYAAAEALGVGLVNAIVIGNRDTDRDLAAETFASVCDVAARHGLRCTLEFARGTLAPDLATAVDIIRRAARPNARLMVDTWHLHFGRTPWDAVGEVPGDLIAAVQLSDGPSERPADYGWATRHDRLVPGEGAIPLTGIVEALGAIGASCPLTLEVFNDRAVAALGPAAYAARLADATRRTLAIQRSRMPE